MIIRLTQSLNARIEAGTLEALPLHENPLLDWSAYLFPVGRSRFILLANTVSLLSAVVPGRGVTSEYGFRVRALDGIRACLAALGLESISRTVIPADTGPVRYAKALNRSVSGSMNELVRQAEPWLAEGDLTLPEVGDRLNDTLLSALAAGGSHGYGKPREAFQVLVNEAESNEAHQTGDRHHAPDTQPD